MVNMTELCENCLRSETKFTIDASTISDFVKSPYKLWCDCHAPTEAKDPLTEYDKLLFEQGKEHEKKTVEIEYPQAETIIFTKPEEGFGLALEAMQSGVGSLHNIPIFYPVSYTHLTLPTILLV